MSRRSLARLHAYFLVIEDPQRRLDKREVETLAHQVSLVRHILESERLNRVLIADEVGLRGIEAMKVEAACGGGGAALHVGYLAVASGQAQQLDLASNAVVGNDTANHVELALNNNSMPGPGEYTLTAANASGSCSAALTTLQGEQGLAGMVGPTGPAGQSGSSDGQKKRNSGRPAEAHDPLAFPGRGSEKNLRESHFSRACLHRKHHSSGDITENLQRNLQGQTEACACAAQVLGRRTREARRQPNPSNRRSQR